MPERNLVRNGEIVLDGYIVQSADVWPEDSGHGVLSPAMLDAALSQIDGDVVIWVNSPGGNPVAAENMRVMLAQRAATDSVTVRVAGDAASAASLMIMGASRIEMSLGSVFMIHDPATITFGTEADHRRGANALSVLAQTYAEVYAARSGQTPEAVRQMMLDETWMGPAEAVEMGFADAVMSEAGRSDMSAPVAAMTRSARGAVAAAQENVRRMSRDFSRRAMASESVPDTGTEPAAGGGHNMEGHEMPDTNPAANSGSTNPQQGTSTATAPSMSNAAQSTAVPTSPDRASAGQGGGAEAPRQPEMTAAPRQSDADAVTAERARITAIMAAAQPHIDSGALGRPYVNALIEEGVSVEMASHRILNRLSGAQGEIEMAGPALRNRVGRTEQETRREGLTMALTARLSGVAPEGEAAEQARPYMDMSIHEMAAVSVGRDRPGFGSYASREETIQMAMHTSSDFPNILSTSVNRILQQNYELVERTFTGIAAEMSFNDFRPHDVIRPDEFPELQKVNEGGEIKFGTLGDTGEKVTLGAYATGVTISRQALVNDDLGAIEQVINNAAAIVPEFEETLFWSVFLGNPALSDGTAMFHADHGNLAGSGTAITVAALSAGRQALRSMKAADGKRAIMLNAPSILLVGPAKETEAEQIVRTITAAKAADVNPFSGRLQIVVTEAITGNEWYLLVDPSRRTHNFKYGYLRDRAAPRVRTEEPFGRQGMSMTLEHDFGAGGVNYRGGYKNPGA